MMRSYINLKLFILALLLCLPFHLSAQTEAIGTANGGKVTKEVLKSKLMKRDMPYNLLLPKEYTAESNKLVRYPVIYLLHGLTGNYSNWAERIKLAEYAANYRLIIVMPDGNNGWYTDSVSNPEDKFESYIVNELIPEIDKIYRTKADRKGRAIAGLSMGGYGSLKFGVKYPEMFALAGSFSGALGVTDITDKNSLPFVAKSVMSVYGDSGSETRVSNDLFRLLKEFPPGKVGALPFIYLDCGTEDFLIQNNRDFVTLLVEKKVPHEFRQLPGGHDWRFWDSQIQEFFRLAPRFLLN